MDFPRYVFTSPGKEKVKEGSYGTRLVQNDEEYEAALKAGFFATMPEAIEGAKVVKKEKAFPEEVIEKKQDIETTEEPEMAKKKGRKPKAE